MFQSLQAKAIGICRSVSAMALREHQQLECYSNNLPDCCGRREDSNRPEAALLLISVPGADNKAPGKGVTVQNAWWDSSIGCLRT